MGSFCCSNDNSKTLADVYDWSEIDAEEVAKLMLNKNDKMIIIDVRESDKNYMKSDWNGGNIKGSINISKNGFKIQLPNILKTYSYYNTIIFHCMHSQHRGPFCCTLYCWARKLLLNNSDSNNDNMFEDGLKQLIPKNNNQHIVEKYHKLHQNNEIKLRLENQKVYVLKRGFNGWINKYGNNDQLIENFDASVWTKNGEFWTQMTQYERNDV
eukprot:503819_1